MSTELIAILAVGVALATLIANGQHTLRSEMQTQRAETRAEFQAVRDDMQTQRTDTQAEFHAVRAEMQLQREETQAEFHAVRTEMQAQRKDINGLLGRMAHLEGLLEGLREAIAGRSVAAAENPTQNEQRQPGSAIPQP